LTDFQLINSTNITLSGYPAKQHVYVYKNNDLTTSVAQLQLTLVNRTGYGLLYVGTPSSVYNTYIGIAQNMTKSFNVVK